jgi:choline dehydrogenase
MYQLGKCSKPLSLQKTLTDQLRGDSWHRHLGQFHRSDVFNNAYEEYITNATGPLATTGASSGLLSCPQIGYSNLTPPSPGEGTSPGLASQFALLSQHFLIEAVTQELSVPGGMSPQFANDTTKLFVTNLTGNFFTILGVLEHPFSRGSTHIKSTNASVYPLIDPRYLSHPFDLQVLSKIALHLQNVTQTLPLSNYLRATGRCTSPDI